MLRRFSQYTSRNFHLENLTVQLGQFAAFLDTSNISVTKFFKSLLNFGKTKSQKMLLPEVTKLTKLLLVLSTINATCEQSFSAVKVLILGDFNEDILGKHLKYFCDNYNLKSSTKQSTYYKNSDSLICID